MWLFAPLKKTYAGIMNFVFREYHYAFTKKPLPIPNFEDRLPFFEGFWYFMREFFCTVLEENYHMMEGFSMVSDPVSGYYLIYFTGSMAMAVPVWITGYLYALYRVYVWFKNKTAKNKPKIEEDPDFEPEENKEEEKKEEIKEEKKDKKND